MPLRWQVQVLITYIKFIGYGYHKNVARVNRSQPHEKQLVVHVSARYANLPKPTTCTCAIDDKPEPQLHKQLKRSFQNKRCDSAF